MKLKNKILLLTQKFTSRYFLKYLLLIIFCSLFLSPIGTSALFESSVSEAKLISSVGGVGSQNTIWVGLEIHLKPGWKTYWRTPGTTGYGLKVDWSESRNLKSVKVYWPAPLKFETFKIMSNGYKEEVILPIQIALKNKHSPLLLKAKLDYLACDSGNCIPQNKMVILNIPDAPAFLTGDAKKIVAASNQVPKAPSSDFDIQSVQLIQNENEASFLRVLILHTFPLFNPEIFIEGTQKLFFDKMISMTTTDSRGKQLSVIDLPIQNNEKRNSLRPPNLIGKPITVTLKNGDQAVEKAIFIAAPPLNSLNMLLMYCIALLGGFILNFMPCVLPVILLKVFSLTKYGGQKVSEIRKSLFFTILGIITSFILLAIIPISLDLFGISFGWGMHFQEPLFLVFMMFILTLFAANFWGWYEILLPEKIASFAHLQGSTEGNVGHFLTGMFATLLSTPCSAPYLGTAITFALSRGPLEIILIFFFIGIGLALPLIIIMICPQLSSFLPKPGKWTEVFKYILGWLFFFTMFWLFYILIKQVTFFFALFILSIMLSYLLVFWLGTKLPKYKGICISYAIFAPLFFTIIWAAMDMKKDLITSEKTNINQTLNIIQSSVNQGKIVFVDVTADWCLTCKANDFLVLNTSAVQNLLKINKVIFIKIDWTSKDPEVYEYLKSFNHNGIPFYVIYGPRNSYGQPLPQILTFSILEKALKKEKNS